MTRSCRTPQFLVSLALMALAATSARADLSASYDGSLMIKGTGVTVAVALDQASVSVTGTMAIDAGARDAAGVYFVTGRVKGGKVALTGANTAGTRFRWRARRVAGGNLKGKAVMRGPGGKVVGTLLLVRRHVDPPTTPPVTCDNSFFTGQVMGRVLQPTCAACHVAGGAAQSTGFRVTANDPIATQQSMDAFIDHSAPAESRILQKPLALIPHGGGAQLSQGSEQEQILSQWVNLVATGQQCNSQPESPMAAITPTELLVRASMDARGKRPSLEELDAIEKNPNFYTAFVDRYLASPEFLDRVKDVYDDAMLVRREDFTDEARDETSAIYGEALELIAYIVGHDRPFTEIGTADYTVANALFQRDTRRMPFPMEPVVGSAWQPTHYTDGRPHAGLLSTSAFYEVWDTNNTNKNRRRANRWSIVFHCYNFLDTPVDVTRDVDNNDADAVLNAVTTRTDCKACHDRLDPMASFLFPMDNVQRLEDTNADDFFSGDPERWRRANKRPPAVYGVPGTDIRDLGRLLTSNPKFAECQTKRAFKLLFLRDPKTSAEVSTASDFAGRWGSEDGYNFKALVRRWMLSDIYRNRPTDDDPAWVRRVTPERFELLVKDLTGFVWTRDADDDEDDNNPESDPPRMTPVPLLTNEEDGYKIILGGINGVSVSGRSYSLNASIAMVQRKVAALASDYVIVNDLAVPDAQRRLLIGVRGDESPTADEAAIRAAMVTIARRLYGTKLATNAPQVDAWMQLYRQLYGDSTQAQSVPGGPGERAWRGVLVAMLRSPRIVLY